MLLGTTSGTLTGPASDAYHVQVVEDIEVRLNSASGSGPWQIFFLLGTINWATFQVGTVGSSWQWNGKLVVPNAYYLQAVVGSGTTWGVVCSGYWTVQPTV